MYEKLEKNKILIREIFCLHNSYCSKCIYPFIKNINFWFEVFKIL